MRSISISNLKPLSKKSEALLKHMVPIANQRRLYRELRSRRGSHPFSYAELQVTLGFSSRGLIQSSLDALAKMGLLDKSSRAGVNVWTVREVTSDIPAPQSFRGHWDIQVRPHTPNLPVELAVSEKLQLFLKFEHEPVVAAVYLFLRSRIGRQFTKTELAQLFQVELRTMNARIAKLVECGLVSERRRDGIVIVKFVEFGIESQVNDARLKQWLKAEAAVPTPYSANQALLARSSSSSDIRLILDFYEKCLAVRAANSPSKVKLGAGQKTANDRVARSLVKNQTFKDLMPALLFFCLEYRSEAVEEYGRSLMTFQKQLGAITEELDDHLPTDRNYVRNMMLKYGLDAFFPVPDYIDPKALDPRAAATLARNRAKHYEELGWTAEDIAENEEITRQIQEKKAAIIAGRRASAS